MWKWLSGRRGGTGGHGAWWSDPDVDVEVVERRVPDSRRGRHEKEGKADDDAEAAPESRLNPPAVSTRVGSPLAPRASPEPSDVDLISSPRWPRGSVVTAPGSAGGSPPLGATASMTPAVVQRCRSAGSMTAERPDAADLDYYNSLRFTGSNTNKGTRCAFNVEWIKNEK